MTNHYEFDENAADAIIAEATDHDLSLPNAVAHLCAVIAGLCPDKEFALDILANVYDNKPIYHGWEVPPPEELTH